MRRTTMTVVMMALAVLVAGEAMAQTCRGTVAIGQNSARGIAGTAVQFNGSIAAYSGQIGGGTDNVFGLGSVGIVHYDDIGGSSFAAGGLFGGQVAADPERKIVVCPFGLVSIESASDFADSGIDFFGLGIGAGVTTGFIVASSETVQLVPTIGFAVVRQRAKFEGFGEEEVVTDTAGALELGLGIVLNGRVSITPGVAIPIGVEDADPSFSLNVSFGFGRR